MELPTWKLLVRLISLVLRVSRRIQSQCSCWREQALSLDLSIIPINVGCNTYCEWFPLCFVRFGWRACPSLLTRYSYRHCHWRKGRNARRRGLGYCRMLNSIILLSWLFFLHWCIGFTNVVGLRNEMKHKGWSNSHFSIVIAMIRRENPSRADGIISKFGRAVIALVLLAESREISVRSRFAKKELGLCRPLNEVGSIITIPFDRNSVGVDQVFARSLDR